MAAKGSLYSHTDLNDYISLIFVIKKVGEGGALDLVETDVMLEFEVGNAVILDSSQVVHGSRAFAGLPEDRLIGIFIIHKPMLKVLALDF